LKFYFDKSEAIVDDVFLHEGFFQRNYTYISIGWKDYNNYFYSDEYRLPEPITLAIGNHLYSQVYEFENPETSIRKL